MKACKKIHIYLKIELTKNIAHALLHLSETEKIQLSRHNTYTRLKNLPLPIMST